MAEGISPYSGGTVPGSHRVPFPLAGLRAETIIAPVSRDLVKRWALVVLWMGLIFWLSSIPSLSSGLGNWDLLLRKLAHLTEYAVLGALLARVLPAFPALWIGMAYAASDEIHQSLVPGREGALLDVGLDSVGVLVGILILQRSPWRPERARTPEEPVPLA